MEENLTLLLMSSLQALLPEIYVDVPNKWDASIEFKEAITAMDISYHGHMIAVGFSSGEIIICDSETGINKRTMNLDSNPISAISFSRDGSFLIAGDSNGMIKGFETLTQKVLFEHTFSEKITRIQCCSLSIQLALVISGQTLQIISIDQSHELSIFSSITNALDAKWKPNSQSLVASVNKQLHIIDSNGIDLFVLDVKAKKPITSIVMSHLGNLLFALDQTGSGHLFMFDNDSLSLIYDIKKDIDIKYSNAVFDRKDNNLILAPNTGPCKMIVHSVIENMMVNQLLGPSDSIKKLFFHPLQPIVFTLGVKTIRIWTPTFTNKSSIFLPGFTELTTNELYDEREDEFDEEEEKQEIIPPSCAIDIITSQPTYYFPDDKDYPNLVIDLPFDLNHLPQINNKKQAQKPV